MKSGTKLNETSKSYIQLNEAIKKINSPNVHFIWVTDGIGWLKTKNGIKEAYNKIKHLYNIDNLENHVIYEDFKDILKKK